MLAERKCYCESCGTEFKFQEGAWDDNNCPVCGNDNPDYLLIPIPDYETPEQYEKRTGKAFPDNGIVFVGFGTALDILEWEAYLWGVARRISQGRSVVIADPPVPPPDNWKPGE
jgi:hypothetical protein